MSPNVNTPNPKDEIGRLKPPLHLVPPVANVLESMVFALGAVKYGPYNWRLASVSATVYISALHRHVSAWVDGEQVDPESGISHLAHARACLSILLDAQMNGKMIDDRPPPANTADVIRSLTKRK